MRIRAGLTYDSSADTASVACIRTALASERHVPISTAVQRGTMVQVYDSRGRPLFCRSGELHGFSGAAVSVRRGRLVYTYDEHGRQISSR